MWNLNKIRVVQRILDEGLRILEHHLKHAMSTLI
jgi:hypothetical protein